MVPIIFNHQGTLDKFMGDGLMAFFGAPIFHDYPAVQAVEAAIAMQEAVREFNRRDADKDWPELYLGIGINAGDVVAGYIGSEDQLSYTVIGDAVNVAQRIESIAEKNAILISGKALNEIYENPGTILERYRPVEIPNPVLKGKAKHTDVYRLEMIAGGPETLQPD